MRNTIGQKRKRMGVLLAILLVITAIAAVGGAAIGARHTAVQAAADVSKLPTPTHDGFSVSEIPDDVVQRITGVSYRENDNIALADLRYLQVLYVDFEGVQQRGEMICNAAIAQDLLEIFRALYDARYPIASIRLVDDFGGDDGASMAANNTSCFNYREIAGTGRLSNHALGMAVDINPLYNPYMIGETALPAEADAYADRDLDFPGKIDSDDLCYGLFTARGFVWGGAWPSPDYQHFEKALS